MKRSRSGARFGIFCVALFLLAKPWFPPSPAESRFFSYSNASKSQALMQKLRRQRLPVRSLCWRDNAGRRPLDVKIEDFFEVLLPQPVLSLMYLR